MKDIIKLHNDVVTKKISVNDLAQYKENTFKPIYDMIISHKMTNSADIFAFIKLCNDYYTYSDTGDLLIGENEYEKVSVLYTEMGFPRIIYADVIPDYTTWPFIEHTAPGMVGSLGKIYTKDELKKYLMNLYKIMYLILAPKFDGISVCIRKIDGRVIYAVTRADGSRGQNILPVVQSAGNIHIFSEADPNTGIDNMPDGYYKCEIVMHQKDFDELIQEKKYANRRSATSGIVNSPKNLQYAKYLTIIPLAYFNGKDVLQYIAPGQKKIPYTTNTSVVLEEIEKMLAVIRKSDYPYRTDGVVIYPDSPNLLINPNDIMEESIAFKVNTAEAFTTIEYGYMSVGRLGNAIPMVKVKPVEVNETTVNDVSLGSYDKYAAMDLHEGETVIVYSAGLVIPQIRVPENRQYPARSEYLKIKKTCPYCEEKLERIGNEYKCTNSNCVRINSGKITNFLVKLEVDNVSDKTVEDLYNAKLIRYIEDLFTLSKYDIEKLDGYSEISAENIIKAIDKLTQREITVSELFGAIGIPDISEKKCRKMFQFIKIKNVLEDSKNKIVDKVLNADGIGMKTAEDFANFIVDNRRLIRTLIERMNVIVDRQFKGNVVFTGFRDKELQKEFESIGYEVASDVNGQTVAVISSENNETSTKCKKARSKGISIVNLADIDSLLTGFKTRELVEYKNYPKWM